MKIFAIGDLHLSFGETVEKPMDRFGDLWENHARRLQENWTRLVGEEDLVILCGDLSWGLQLEEAMADLHWIHALPGRKVMFKGNHDLWWQSTNKLNQLYDDGTMIFMQNHCYICEMAAGGGDDASAARNSDGCGGQRIAICGSRGWLCPGTEGFGEHDEKIYRRELLRLEFSLQEAVAAGADRLIGVLHYPPTNEKQQDSGFTELLQRYGVSTCVYGHLHGRENFKRGLTAVFNGVDYRLVSLDYVGATPQRIV